MSLPGLCSCPSHQVRGQDIPRPVKTWTQCGINVKVLDVLKKHGFERPLAIQAQVRSRLGCCLSHYVELQFRQNAGGPALSSSPYQYRGRASLESPG